MHPQGDSLQEAHVIVRVPVLDSPDVFARRIVTDVAELCNELVERKSCPQDQLWLLV